MYPDLKPGMIGVSLKGFIDPMGTIDTVLQGDTEAAHVWWVLPSDRIATTGAKAFVFYGEVEAAKYLRGKTFYLLETVDPLPADKLARMQAAHDDLMHSGAGRLYGLWKFPLLGLLAARHGDVDKMGRKPKITRPVCPICSQAVAWCFWHAGIPIGKMFGKEDWSAVLPETILKEAKAVSFMLASGALERRDKPCYMLKTVRERPFVGN
jgi:hypothetical protein